jgi:transcriptional regulator GlxA family with amidase domain
MRLVSGSFRKDFVDIFAVELAVFEFVIAYERLAHRLSDPSCEGERMLESVRKLIHADPQRSLDVTTLASEYGMGRSHFTRVFRARTGQTPACVIAQARVEEASRMLRHGRASLRQIASACGFVSVNHFSRVFYRFQHINPGAYRKLIAISKR